jgi:hypothetical protein
MLNCCPDAISVVIFTAEQHLVPCDDWFGVDYRRSETVDGRHPRLAGDALDTASPSHGALFRSSIS